MHVNKTKFERNSSLECYHMTCIVKTKHTSYLKVYSLPSLHDFDVKMPKFTICRGREHQTTTFLFFS